MRLQLQELQIPFELLIQLSENQIDFNQNDSMYSTRIHLIWFNMVQKAGLVYRSERL